MKTAKTAKVLSATLLFAMPLAAACAGDRNKQVQEASLNQAEASRSEREAQIDQMKKEQVEAIENTKPRTENMPEATQQRAKAESQMMQERQKFQVNAQARLQKAQARLDEARQKIQIAGGRAPVSLTDQVNSADRMTSTVSTEINRLPQVSGDAWDVEKKSLETRLDEIDKTVDDVKSKADSLK